MIRALIDHTWLLMTFRHDQRGLRLSTVSGFLVVVGLSALLALARLGDPLQAAAHGALILMVSAWSPRAAVAYALLSVGVDAVAIPFESAFGRAATPWFSVWELAGIFALACRAIRADRKSST